MIYYPEHLKYVDFGVGEREALLPRPSSKDRVRSVEWRLSVIAAWIIGFHLYALFCFYVTDLTIAFLQLLHRNNDNIPSHGNSLITRRLASTSLGLGNISWYHRRYTCSDSICSTVVAYIPIETRQCAQHTDDDDPDAWWLPYGDEYRVETWDKLDEYVTDITSPVLLIR
jgi:hypothetical protein